MLDTPSSIHHQQVPFPRGIFFDMDGTLLLMTQNAEQTWLDVFTHFGPQHALSPAFLSKVMHQVYIDYKQEMAEDEAKQRRDRLHPFAVRKELVEQVLRLAGKADAVLAENMVHLYESLRDKHRQLTPFAIEILNSLKKQHIHLALLTNGNATYQRRKIEQHHLAPFFEGIFIEEELGVGKSDTSMYQAALEQLHLQAQETWMIGDDLVFDIATPQRLGMFTFWFDPHEKSLPLHASIYPDRIIHALPEILQIVASLKNTSS